MTVISENISDHGKPTVHIGRPAEEETVPVIYLGSVSTALVDRFRISPSRQNRKSCQNIFYLWEEVRSGFILNKTLTQSVMGSWLLQSQKYKAHGSFTGHFT